MFHPFVKSVSTEQVKLTEREGFRDDWDTLRSLGAEHNISGHYGLNQKGRRI